METPPLCTSLDLLCSFDGTLCLLLANNLFLVGGVCFQLLEFSPNNRLASGLTTAGHIGSKNQAGDEVAFSEMGDTFNSHGSYSTFQTQIVQQTISPMSDQQSPTYGQTGQGSFLRSHNHSPWCHFPAVPEVRDETAHRPEGAGVVPLVRR